jgi:hypothetical protein
MRIIHQENTGLKRILIPGCYAAQGEFIARQDACDISPLGRLQSKLTVLRRAVVLWTYFVAGDLLAGRVSVGLHETAIMLEQLQSTDRNATKQSHYSRTKRLWKGFCSQAAEINWVCCMFAHALRALEPSLELSLTGVLLGGQCIVLGRHR